MHEIAGKDGTRIPMRTKEKLGKYTKKLDDDGRKSRIPIPIKKQKISKKPKEPVSVKIDSREERENAKRAYGLNRLLSIIRGLYLKFKISFSHH